MRFLHIIIFLMILIAVVLSNIPEDVSSIDPMHAPVLNSYNWHALKERYGDTRNLTHSEVRRLYHSIIYEITEYFNNYTGYHTKLDQTAAACSAVRSSAKIYARSRDKVSVASILLQVRDSFVYGISYFPSSLRKDFQNFFLTGNYSFRKTVLTFYETASCLLPYFSNQACPSYRFMKEVLNKGDDKILSGCTKTNEFFDTYFGSLNR
ncbi:unnamed protein product [Phytomonas sp. EM1]|nr:unnamed protein product [Phytomonas sp. EM1]|eukprot:CCW60345.1 unnamed protein product [Phytomonas sp. isolate EM1]